MSNDKPKTQRVSFSFDDSSLESLRHLQEGQSRDGFVELTITNPETNESRTIVIPREDAQPIGLDSALALEADNQVDYFQVAAAIERQPAAVEAERDRLKADSHTEWIRKHMQALRNGIAAMTQKALGDDEIEAFPYEIIKALGLEQQECGVDVLAAIQSLRETASQTIEANDTLFEGSALTVNILRLWDRDRIERFALHLLGDEWQGLKAETDRLNKRLLELHTAVGEALPSGLSISGSPIDALRVMRAEIDRLKEWRDSVSNAIKQIPEFTTGKWGGDKDGWGYHFEIVRWITESYGDLTARIAKVEEYGREYIERTDTQIEGLIKKLEQVETDRNHALATLIAASAALADAGFKGETVGEQVASVVVRVAEMESELSTERKSGDGWQWIREKLKACCSELMIPQRQDDLAGTKYEVMGWMHVLCSYAQSANHCYLSIAVEQQKRAEELEADNARLRQQVREIGERVKAKAISLLEYQCEMAEENHAEFGVCNGIQIALNTINSSLDLAACGATAEGDNYNE